MSASDRINKKIEALVEERFSEIAELVADLPVKKRVSTWLNVIVKAIHNYHDQGEDERKCPFCGADDSHFEHHRSEADSDIREYHFTCLNCGKKSKQLWREFYLNTKPVED